MERKMIEFIRQLLTLFTTTPQAKFRSKLIKVARSELGNGEVKRNNSGPHVERYARSVGMETPILWCAAFVSYCYYKTCKRLDQKPIRIGRANAKRLSDAVIAHEGLEVHLDDMQPGDFVVWHRGTKEYQGHIGICSRVDKTENVFYTIEGNKGKYPSKVRAYKHEFGEPELYRVVRVKELI